jgi:hypothetical protein
MHFDTLFSKTVSVGLPVECPLENINSAVTFVSRLGT